MPQDVGIRVEGLSNLRNTLRAADRSLTKDLREANKEAATVVAKEAKAATVPRRSGRLAGSIRPGATQTAGVVRAGKAGVPYAGVIHFGWPRRRISPQPFLYEAADRRLQEVTDLYAERVDKILNKIKGE